MWAQLILGVLTIMKKTNIFLTITKVFCILFSSFYILAACSQPTSTPSNQGSTATDNTTESDSSGDSNSTDTQDNPETPSAPAPSSPQIVLILPQNSTSSFSTDCWNDITFVSGNDLNKWQNAFTSSTDCQIEIMENGNENNINLETVVYSDKISVKCNGEGTVSFRIKNTSANLVTNYTMISFVSSSANTNNPNRFYGTWRTADTYLIDTITFNQNGSGEQYNSNYSSSRTNIAWFVTNANTIHITSGGSSCNATYSFSEDLQTLRLTNLWDYNQTLTFTKQ